MTASSPGADPLRVETREEGAVAREIEVEVPAAQVDAAFERAYRQLGRSVRVRGFRPGKVPASVLRKLYGGAVAEDVERELVSGTLRTALEQAGLVPVSEPAIDAGPPAEGAPFTYRARIEIKPAIPLGEVAGLPGRRPSSEVAEADVQQELERLQQRHAQLVEEPEGTEAAAGHFLGIDFVGRVDGEPFEGGTARDTTVELGSGQLVPGFEEQLTGLRAGEDRTVRVRFPDDYGNPQLAGKDAAFDVHVVSLRRREVPALDDEFAKDLGDFESLAQVRDKIRESLVAARERHAKLELRRSVLDALLERTPFDVPAGLVHERLHRRIHTARHDLEERGVRRDLVDRQAARWEEEWRPAVEREIREEWVLEAVAEQQGLRVEDAEVDARIDQLAAEQGRDPARVRKAYREAGVLEAIRGQVLEDKAVEFLLGAASVEQAPTS